MTLADSRKELALEGRLRRLARSEGLVAHKSRVHATHADNQGGWMLVTATRNSVVAGERFELTTQDAIDFIQEHYRNSKHPTVKKRWE